jgi:hypothetical protein
MDIVGSSSAISGSGGGFSGGGCCCCCGGGFCYCLCCGDVGVGGSNVNTFCNVKFVLYSSMAFLIVTVSTEEVIFVGITCKMIMCFDYGAIINISSCSSVISHGII